MDPYARFLLRIVSSLFSDISDTANKNLESLTMAEAGGLVLGGIGLIRPAIESYRKCIQLYHDIRNHQRDFQIGYSSLLIQKELFESECFHLLEPLVPENVANELLADAEHPLWKGVQFRKDFLQSLSVGQREALSLIWNIIEGIETDLQHYLDHRLDWARVGKVKVKGSLDTLWHRTIDLKNLREARKRPNGNNEAPQRREKPARPRSGASRFPLRHSARRLHSNLKPVVCQCHCLNLKLDGTRPKQEEPLSAAEFSLIITDNPSCSISMCLSIIASRDGVLQETINGASFGSDIARETPDSHTISHLCPLKLPKTTASSAPRVYLGNFKDPTESRYFHSIYQHRDAIDRLSRISLAKHLESNTFSRRRRLHLAMLLATALLHYGSFRGSWFRDSWSSGDVFFFIDKDQGLLPTSFPHITIPKSKPKCHHHRAPVNNNQLLSLAVVMTEIALGITLGPLDRDSNPDAESSERNKVRELLRERKNFTNSVGRKYAEAVATCLNSDYTLGTGDLKEEDVRDAFYENVVLKLERCVEELDK